MPTISVITDCPFCGQEHEEIIQVEQDVIDAILDGGPEAEHSISYRDTYLCGHPIGDGDDTCSREVDGPNEYCFQHE